MQTRLPLLSFLLATVACSAVEVDVEAFGESLGGWDSKRSKAAEYEISGANYRTYKPEVSPSPDGGIFVSLRIDHMRGLLASDDHASLEMSFSPDGTLVTAQSSIALQGHTITSELIRGGAAATIHLRHPSPGASSGLPAGSGEQLVAQALRGGVACATLARQLGRA